MTKTNIINIITAGLIGGYAESAAQLTPGPGDILSKARNIISHKAPALAELTVCGWCLAPWVTIPVYLAVSKGTNHRIVGALSATALAALYRHLAEQL